MEGQGRGGQDGRLEVSGDWDQAGGGDEKWSDTGYIFTADPHKVLTDRRWGTKKEEESRITPGFLT